MHAHAAWDGSNGEQKTGGGKLEKSSEAISGMREFINQTARWDGCWLTSRSSSGSNFNRIRLPALPFL